MAFVESVLLVVNHVTLKILEALRVVYLLALCCLDCFVRKFEKQDVEAERKFDIILVGMPGPAKECCLGSLAK